MEKLITKAGVKVYESGKHIKTFSKKYLCIENEIDFTTDTIKITPREKMGLDEKLKTHLKKERFNNQLTAFLKELKVKEKYVFYLVKDSEHDFVRKVKVANQGLKYELVFKNGTALRIEQTMYKNCANKGDCKISAY